MTGKLEHFKRFKFSLEDYTRSALNPGSEFHEMLEQVRCLQAAAPDLGRWKSIRRFVPNEDGCGQLEQVQNLLSEAKQLRMEGKWTEAGQKAQEAAEEFCRQRPELNVCHPGILVEQGIAALHQDNQTLVAFHFFRLAVENEWVAAKKLEHAAPTGLDRIRHMFRLGIDRNDQQREKTEAEKHFHELLPQVDEIDNNLLEKVFAKRQNLCNLIKMGVAATAEFKFSLQSSYIKMLYNTVAIEGVNVSLDQTYELLKNGLQNALNRQRDEGESVVDSEMAKLLGTAKAYALIWDQLKQKKLSLQFILKIHALVMSGEHPIQAARGGKLRDDAVITKKQNEKHLDNLIGWINRGLEQIRLGQMDPFLVASLAHCFLIFLHPFEDGNGRTSRCIMHFILIYAGFPPTIVPKVKLHDYLDLQDEGWQGDFRPFVRFICNCALETIEDIIRESNVAEMDVLETGRATSSMTGPPNSPLPCAMDETSPPMNSNGHFFSTFLSGSFSMDEGD